MTVLNFPQTTVVGKHVPKTAFYKNLEVCSRMKQHFVDDVERITWLYKLAPSTLNVTDGTTVHEIVVFGVQLKERDCPTDMFLFIDQNMPRHVVFVLEYGGECKVMLNYKEWADVAKGTFRIVKTFSSGWMRCDELSLPLEGQTMDVVYETMAGAVSGFGTTSGKDTKRIVELQALIDKTMKDVEVLQRKIRGERQLNIQIEMNGEARRLKRQLAQWNAEILQLKR